MLSSLTNFNVLRIQQLGSLLEEQRVPFPYTTLSYSLWYYSYYCLELQLPINEQYYPLIITNQMRKLLLLCFPQWFVNKIFPYRFDQLKQAIIKSDLQALSTIMQSSPKFGQDDNVLMFALNQAKEEVILYLIQHYYHQLDFQRRNDKGDSPLMVAIFRKKKEAFRALLHHSQIRACDFFRNTAFIAAAANGDIQALESLIAHPDNNPNAKNGDGHTALHRACYFGEMLAIEWLLERTGLKIGDIDKKGNNGLHLACLGGQIATTRYLVAKVKKPTQLLVPNHEGNKPNLLLEETLRKLGGYWKESDLQTRHLLIDK